jgi:hypothetical protein
MNSSRLVAAVVGHGLVAVALLCCGGSTKSSGVTNVQPPEPRGYVPGGQCLSRGTGCVTDKDCCSEWCANGRCTTKSP